MHKYKVIMDDTMRNIRGKKIYTTEEHEIERISCPKNGDIVTFVERYGYLQDYKLERIYNHKKVVCFIATRTKNSLKTQSLNEKKRSY